jgi:flagellar basal body-associated protein FliL
MAGIGGRSRRRRYSEDRKEDRFERRDRARGCLWYLLIILIVMLILSLMFGGFKKGKIHDSMENRAPVSGNARLVSPGI